MEIKLPEDIYLPPGKAVPDNDDYAEFIGRQPCALCNEPVKDAGECQVIERSIGHHAQTKGRRHSKKRKGDVKYGAIIPVCLGHHIPFLHGFKFCPKSNPRHRALKERLVKEARYKYPRLYWAEQADKV